MTTTKSNHITGGKKGFIAAIDKAFYGDGSKMSNPTIRYSHERGFHVESGIHPADSDVIWSEAANYWANTGAKTVAPKDYNDVRETILNSDAE